MAIVLPKQPFAVEDEAAMLALVLDEDVKVGDFIRRQDDGHVYMLMQTSPEDVESWLRFLDTTDDIDLSGAVLTTGNQDIGGTKNFTDARPTVDGDQVALRLDLYRALGWIDVTDPAFGGTWDGVADDTSAWQAASTFAGEDSAFEEGAVVYAPPGTKSYCNPGAFAIPVPWEATWNPIKFFTDGCYIKLSQKASCFVQPVSTADPGTETFQGLHIEGDFTFDANNVVNNGSSNNLYGVIINWGKYQSIDDLHIIGTTTLNLGAFTVNASRRSVDITQVSSLVFEDSPAITMTNIHVKRNRFNGGNYAVEIQAYTATDHSQRLKRFEPWVMNCYMNDIEVDDNWWDGGANPTTPTVADGGTGIMIGGMGYGDRIRIRRNVLKRSIDDGIEVGPFTDCLIEDNVVEDCLFENVLIRMLGACPDQEKLSYVVRNNRIGFTHLINYSITGYQNKGILFDPPGSIHMEGNEFYNCTTPMTLNGSYHTANLINNQVDFFMDVTAPADSYGLYFRPLMLLGKKNGVINIDGLHVRSSFALANGGHTNLQLYERIISFDHLANYDISIKNVTVNQRDVTLTNTPSTRGYEVLRFDQANYLTSVETFSAASSLEDRYFYDDGDFSDLTVSGGVATSDTISDEIRTIALYTAAEEIWPTVDVSAHIKQTTGTTITDHKTGIVTKRLSATTYLECYITDDGTNSLLCIDKVVSGTRTSLLGTIVGGGAGTVTAISTPTAYQSDRGVALASRVATSTAYYVRGQILDGVVKADYFTATPGIPTTTGTSTASVTLSAADNLLFADPVEGYPGFSWVAMDAAANIDSFTVDRMSVFRVLAENVSLATEAVLNNASVGMVNFPTTNYSAYIRTPNISVRRVRMAGNDFSTASTSAVVRNLTNMGTQRSKFSLRDTDYVTSTNQGTISAPGSGTAYQNLDGVDELVIWTAGTLTTPFVEYSRDGSTYYPIQNAAGLGSFLLPAGHYLKWTYSSFPTVTKLYSLS